MGKKTPETKEQTKEQSKGQAEEIRVEGEIRFSPWLCGRGQRISDSRRKPWRIDAGNVSNT